MNTHAEEAQIRSLIDEQLDALRNRDADYLAGRYLPEIVLFSLAPPLSHSGVEVTDPAGLRAWFATFDGPVDAEARELEVIIGGDVAYAHSLNRLSAIPKGMSEPFDLWFRSTVCFRKVGAEWKVAHEHQSTPFYMDGEFGAAIDLQPEGSRQG